MPFYAALCFGLVVGWVTYRSLRREQQGGVADLTAVVAAISGAGIMKLFNTCDIFSGYCVGLAIGFFAYLYLTWKAGLPPWALR